MMNQIEPGGLSSHGTQNKPVLYMNNHVALVHMVLKPISNLQESGPCTHGS